MIIQTCNHCGNFYLDKKNWKFCPVCGHDLIKNIRIK